MTRTLSFARIVIPIVYLLGGAGLWVDFIHSPPDGLANVGLILYTLPFFVVARFFTALEFPFFGGDYYDAHRIYFMISVGTISLLLFAFISLLHLFLSRRRPG